MKILQITENKEQFMDLLLIADEQENMIKKYLDRGDLFALYDDDLKTVAVVTKENDDTYEIKNIATYEKYQGKGYGGSMIKYIIQHYKNQCKASLSQNSVSFRTSSLKKWLTLTFSFKSKEAVPRTEVLEQPQVLIVGTGENEKILSFYKNLGFTYSHTIKDFFIDNYDHEMFEDGVQLRDMIYLKMGV